MEYLEAKSKILEWLNEASAETIIDFANKLKRED